MIAVPDSARRRLVIDEPDIGRIGDRRLRRYDLCVSETVEHDRLSKLRSILNVPNLFLYRDRTSDNWFIAWHEMSPRLQYEVYIDLVQVPVNAEGRPVVTDAEVDKVLARFDPERQVKNVDSLKWAEGAEQKASEEYWDSIDSFVGDARKTFRGRLDDHPMFTKRG